MRSSRLIAERGPEMLVEVVAQRGPDLKEAVQDHNGLLLYNLLRVCYHVEHQRHKSLNRVVIRQAADGLKGRANCTRDPIVTKEMCESFSAAARSFADHKQGPK